MQSFKWTKAHAVHLAHVDAEHRNLYRMAEELQQAARAGAEVARILELARAMAAAIEEHFSHEERLMKSAACPDFEWHKSQHDVARKRVKQFLKDLEAGNAESTGELLDYLARWLKDHLALSDRMMGAHLRNYERLSAKLAS